MRRPLVNSGVEITVSLILESGIDKLTIAQFCCFIRGMSTISELARRLAKRRKGIKEIPSKRKQAAARANLALAREAKAEKREANAAA